MNGSATGQKAGYGLDAETRALFGETLAHLLPVSSSKPQQNGGQTWANFAESGVLALGLPESVGGLDGTLSDLGLVMRRLGMSLQDQPFLSAVILGGKLIADLDPELAGEVLPRLGAGQLVLSLAHSEPGVGFHNLPLSTFAERRTDGVRLTGSKCLILDGAKADAFLVSADIDGQARLFLVDARERCVALAHQTTVDGRSLSSLVLDASLARPIGNGDAARAIAQAQHRATIALCAEALGIIEAVVEQTRVYLQTRRAFGRSLSQFQALQHRFVEMLIAHEEASAIVGMAEMAQDDTLERLARICKITTSKAGRFVGEQGVQLHGGVGTTDELAISHYYKRLMAIDAAFGNGEHHLRQLASAAQQEFACSSKREPA